MINHVGTQPTPINAIINKGRFLSYHKQYMCIYEKGSNYTCITLEHCDNVNNFAYNMIYANPILV